MMLVAIVPLWVIALLFAINAVLAIEEVTEAKTDWRQKQVYKDPLEDMRKRIEMALIPGSADLEPLLKCLAASR